MDPVSRAGSSDVDIMDDEAMGGKKSMTNGAEGAGRIWVKWGCDDDDARMGFGSTAEDGRQAAKVGTYGKRANDDAIRRTSDVRSRTGQ